MGQRESPIVRGGGTGIIIKANGVILTNNHVIDGAETIKVKLADGREFDGRVKGSDPRSDLALVTIDAKDLPTVKLGDSDNTKVGEWVIAMGNPYGFDYTVTAGIISAKGRKVTDSDRFEDFLQTDASINPGNSGGPLLNLDGEVIGINTMIAGIGTGIGFAIPSTLAQSIADQLLTSGKVVRPWMGVGIQPVTQEMAQSLGIDAQKGGAIVNQVQPGSPAEKAGMQRGDVVVKVENEKISDADDLVRAVQTRKVGEELKVVVIRDNKEKTLKVTTEAMPESPREALAQGPGNDAGGAVDKLGVEVKGMTNEMAQRYGLRNSEGVVITDIKPDSVCARAGLREGDVVLEVNRRPISNVNDFTQMAGTADRGTLLLLISREGTTLFVPVRLS